MNDEIHDPSEDKWQWLEQAEAHLLQLLRDRYGEVNLKHSSDDLELAQRLINDNVFDSTDILELQCLGVALGNVFAATTSMKWAEVSNEYGELLALHSKEIRFTLYPLTMISNRIKDGREVDMPVLYRAFVGDLGL